MRRKLQKIVPITEIRFILHVGDARLRAYAPKKFITNFVASENDIYLCVNYNSASETYSMQDIIYPGLISLIPDIATLAFYDEDEDEHAFSHQTLLRIAAVIFMRLKRTRQGTSCIFTLVLPAALGAESTSCQLSECAHALISFIQPQDLILISNGSVEHENDTAQYLSRKRNSALGYRLPTDIETVVQVSKSSISFALAGNMDHIGRLKAALKSRLTPASLERLPILSIYILSPMLSRGDARLASMCSFNRKEAFICCIYHQEEGTYEILQINTFPTNKAARTVNTLFSVDVPEGKLVFHHFVQFLQAMRSGSYFERFKFRLFLESGLGDENSLTVSPVVHQLIQTILPEYLHLITSLRSENEVKFYLQRQVTTNGYILPLKGMSGSYIPMRKIVKLLELTRSRESPALLSEQMPVDVSDEKSSDKDSTNLIFDLQEYVDINLIPAVELAQKTEEELLAVSPRELQGSSNKAFTLFRARPLPVSQDRLIFRDECGLKKIQVCPSEEELQAGRRSVYLLTETEFFYYDVSTERLERIQTSESAQLELQQQFPEDILKLSPEQLLSIYMITQHKHQVDLASVAEEEPTCCGCVCS